MRLNCWKQWFKNRNKHLTQFSFESISYLKKDNTHKHKCTQWKASQLKYSKVNNGAVFNLMPPQPIEMQQKQRLQSHEQQQHKQIGGKAESKTVMLVSWGLRECVCVLCAGFAVGRRRRLSHFDFEVRTLTTKYAARKQFSSY